MTGALRWQSLFTRMIEVVPHVLVIRGELSDLFTANNVEAMRALAGPERVSRITEAVQPQTGHAPMLSEPESSAALLEYLRRCN